MDVEAWERDHSEITEFGYGLVKWENEEQKIESGHWVLKGGSRNGTFVHDNRDVSERPFPKPHSHRLQNALKPAYDCKKSGISSGKRKSSPDRGSRRGSKP